MLRRNGSKGWVLEIRNSRKVYERKDCHSCNLRDSYVMRIRKTMKGGSVSFLKNMNPTSV